MIQTDIDLLEYEPRDAYFFALRLISLTKNKKKYPNHRKNSHFKFVLEQEDYVIDQTRNPIENIFWLVKTTFISLNKEVMYFAVADVSESNTDFDLKMYLISQEEVKELAAMQINSITYVQVFLECGKTVFRQTVSLCPQYILEYELYIQNTEISLANLIKDSDSEVQGLKNAFKKKTHQIIQIENQKVQVKPKNQHHLENYILRKSLYVNLNQLIQSKRRRQEIKDKPLSLNTSKSSFFSQLGDFFKSKTRITQIQPIFWPRFSLSSQKLCSLKQKLKERNPKTDSQKLFSIIPPSIHSSRDHKNKRGQKISCVEQSSLNIGEMKQRERVKYYRILDGQQKCKDQILKGCLNWLKVIVLILIVGFAILYFSSGGKKGKYKMLKHLWMG